MPKSVTVQARGKMLGVGSSVPVQYVALPRPSGQGVNVSRPPKFSTIASFFGIPGGDTVVWLTSGNLPPCEAQYAWATTHCMGYKERPVKKPSGNLFCPAPLTVSSTLSAAVNKTLRGKVLTVP